MTLTTSPARPDSRSILRLASSAIAVMAVFIAHHFYGAAIYTAAFRKHAAIVGVPVTLAMALSAYLAVKLDSEMGRKTARHLTYLLIAVFPILGIGLFEGFYNHLLKNLIFLSGHYDEVAPALFPAGMYERPADWLFETSGVLQFVLAVVAARELWRATRGRPGRDL